MEGNILMYYLHLDTNEAINCNYQYSLLLFGGSCSERQRDRTRKCHNVALMSVSIQWAAETL